MAELRQIELHANGLAFPALEMGQGPLVLCLHGFPDNNRSYRFQLSALADAGYRAIAPTMRGYHPACIPPDGDYRTVRLAEDVIGWLDDLGEDTAHIIGHDHGSLVASAACIIAPDRFRSLMMIAVPHPGDTAKAVMKYPSQLLKSWYIFFFQLRPLARYCVEARDWALIEKLWRNWSPGWALPAEDLASVKRTLGQPGVKNGALAYYWVRPSQLNRDGREATDPVRVPTLGLTGALDGCIDTRLFDVTMTKDYFPKGVEIVRIADAGHFVHQEKPEETNQVITEWLGRHGSRAEVV